MEVTGKTAIGAVLVMAMLVGFLFPAEVMHAFNLSEPKKENLDLGDQLDLGDVTTTTLAVESALPPLSRACLDHAYTFGTASVPVKLFVMDALNPKAGIQNLEMEVLNVPTQPYTVDKLFAVASNPMRQIVDEDTATDANGVASFESNTILVYMDYMWALRGGNLTYDKVGTEKIPCIPPEREGYTFPKKMYAYMIGNLSALYTATNVTENVSGLTGQHFITFDITIGEGVPGGVIKAPVVVLRSPDGAELEPGDILSIYLIRKTGTDFGVPGINLADYLVSETPIALKGSIYDESYGAYLMTIADSATYTVKITYDADGIEVGSDQLQIAVDDLGDYRAKDDVTKGVKAAAQTVDILFVD